MSLRDIHQEQAVRLIVVAVEREIVGLSGFGPRANLTPGILY
jgi:hypothetical protein